ncbi:hypothetical protein BC831DRAFT_132780 [Entophlyctis helioformis]|nr:hypothetical protein BC831DRAFT_132780 [Entophlyctis helioformis]
MGRSLELAAGTACWAAGLACRLGCQTRQWQHTQRAAHSATLIQARLVRRTRVLAGVSGHIALGVMASWMRSTEQHMEWPDRPSTLHSFNNHNDDDGDDPDYPSLACTVFVDKDDPEQRGDAGSASTANLAGQSGNTNCIALGHNADAYQDDCWMQWDID